MFKNIFHISNSLIYRISCKICKRFFPKLFDFKKKQTIYYKAAEMKTNYEIGNGTVVVIMSIVYLYIITLFTILQTI